jgi:hypothetical protein
MSREKLSNGLRIGDNIKVLIPGGGGAAKYYKITNRDQLFYNDAHSAITAGSYEDYAEITNLNPPSSEIIQVYKITKNANIQINLKQPATVNRFGTNRSPEGGPIPTDELIDLWILKNYPPQVKLSNNTGVSITPTLKWHGWRYQVDELRAPPEVFTIVSVTGVGGGI